MLDLVLTNKKGLVGNVKFKGSLGCSDHEKVEFKILWAARKVHSILATLDLGKQSLASSGICLAEWHGVVQPGEEKAAGRPYSGLPVLKGCLQESWGGTLYQGVW